MSREYIPGKFREVQAYVRFGAIPEIVSNYEEIYRFKVIDKGFRTCQVLGESLFLLTSIYDVINYINP